MVEGRFRVYGLSGQSEGEGTHVMLQGVQGEPFGRYTQVAHCEMLIINPEAEKQFELNAEYRVTFEKIESPAVPRNGYMDDDQSY
ncbi:hypothetical protein JCM15765_14600 [Paradesulfitobacterium aromaticivorans]